MAIDNDSIRQWLNKHFPKDECQPEPLYGTYGLIWILNAKNKSTYPSSFAIKTVQPGNLQDARHSNDIETIMREFRMWIELPRCLNVVPAFGVENAVLRDRETQREIRLPIMKMPRMQGSLDDWLQHPSEWDQCDRLIALANALNGLQWLYQNGIEGHGDLKPSNFLYDNLNFNFTLDEAGNSWPSKRRPWIVKVSDLGWADAWKDYGFAGKALRQYLAPERLDGTFIPVKSDIFSMGIIAAEILSGKHPCGNVKTISKSEGNWRRWIEGGQRHLDGVTDEGIKKCIIRALSPNYAERPDALEFQAIVMEALLRDHQCDIRATMEFYRQMPDELNKAEHTLWSSGHVSNLDRAQKATSLTKHIENYKSIDPKASFANAEVWLNYAEAILELTAESSPKDEAELREGVLRDLREVALHVLAHSSREELESTPPQKNFASYRPFERLSQFFSVISDHINDGGSLSSETQGNHYAKAAYHFSRAGRARMDGDRSLVSSELSAAVAAEPREATSYFFRARWLLEEVLQRQFAGKKNSDADLSRISLAVNDLKRAIELEPGWKEPEESLSSILSLYSSSKNE